MSTLGNLCGTGSAANIPVVLETLVRGLEAGSLAARCRCAEVRFPLLECFVPGRHSSRSWCAACKQPVVLHLLAWWHVESNLLLCCSCTAPNAVKPIVAGSVMFQVETTVDRQCLSFIAVMNHEAFPMCRRCGGWRAAAARRPTRWSSRSCRRAARRWAWRWPCCWCASDPV